MTKEEFQNTVLPLKNKLFCFANSYLENHEEAKDVVQDVMLKVWENRSKNGEIKNIEAWCMTLVRNRSLDKLKLKSRKNVRMDDSYNHFSDESNLQANLENKDLLQKVKSIIQQLPSAQKEVIRLRDYNGYSYKEIAEVLDIDINLVKVSLHRARKAIKENMNKIMAYGMQS